MSDCFLYSCMMPSCISGELSFFCMGDNIYSSSLSLLLREWLLYSSYSWSSISMSSLTPSSGLTTSNVWAIKWSFSFAYFNISSLLFFENASNLFELPNPIWLWCDYADFSFLKNPKLFGGGDWLTFSSSWSVIPRVLFLITCLTLFLLALNLHSLSI